MRKLLELGRVLVEPAFDEFVVTHGGALVRDRFPDGCDFENADYYFENEEVVVELKCLELDRSSDPKTQEKIDNLYQKWRARKDGVPLIFGTAKISTEDLPERNARELVAVFRDPINDHLKKANRQLKETKARISQNKTYGVVLLVNEANKAMPHHAFVHVLWNILRQRDVYRSIDAFVYLTVNMPSTVPGQDKPSLLWIPIPRPHSEGPREQFINELFQKWVAFLNRITGVPIETDMRDDIEWIKSVEHR